MNYTCLCLPAKLVLICQPRRDGRLSWPWMVGWLHTEMIVRHRELNPNTVGHLSTNRARRRLTSLIETNALTTTPDHQPISQSGTVTSDRCSRLKTIPNSCAIITGLTELLNCASKLGIEDLDVCNLLLHVIRSIVFDIEV